MNRIIVKFFIIFVFLFVFMYIIIVIVNNVKLKNEV